MFVHAKHASVTESRFLTIVSSDTDVFVLPVAAILHYRLVSC